MIKEIPRKSILVSVIVPVLNEKENVRKLIQSVCFQVYRPLEVILIDGGSSDGTNELVPSLIKNICDESLKLILLSETSFSDQKSPAHARNIGVRESSGEYLILLDADTLFKDKASVSRIKSLLDLHAFLRVKSSFQIDTLLEKELSLIHSPYFHCGYRRKIFDKMLFDETLIYGEDRDLWYRIEENLDIKLYTTDEVLLVRHLPHTYKDYYSQCIWYAKSYGNFAYSVLEKRNYRYVDEIADVILGSLFTLYMPLFLMMSFLKDLKSRKGFSFSFIMANSLRRCLFVFFVLATSLCKRQFKIYGRCLSIWLSNKIENMSSLRQRLN